MANSGARRWAAVSSALAPVLLIGGWTLAAHRQPGAFNATTETISALAALGADERWIMTSALAGVGACHLVTAAGLTAAARPGRTLLAAGGASTLLLAGFPLSADGGPAPVHAVAAGAAFGALGLWPALAGRRNPSAPVALRRVVSVSAAGVLLGLVGWFVVELATGGRVGLAERVAAGAQAVWPLVAVLSARRREIV